MDKMLDMTSAQNILLALLRGEKIQNADSINWDAVRQEAISQAVFLTLPKVDILPPEEAAKWEKTMFTMLRSNMESFYAITEMDRVMRAAGQKYVILKGIASALYYPNIFTRALGDVDFLIDPAQQIKVEKAFEAEGYFNKHEIDEYHSAFLKEKQVLEMHFAISGTPKKKYKELIEEYFSKILDTSVLYSINGKTINIPLPKYHGLILLLHMIHHMLSSGFGLRHLIDWCYFVDQTQNDEFWNTDLLPFLEKIGLMHFAQAMTKTGAIYLNTACPGWAVNTDSLLCDAVMHDILAGGNFGRKNNARSSSKIMLTKDIEDKKTHTIIYNLWHTMLGAVRKYHPCVVNFPVLYPIFIAEFLIRRFYNVITGRRPPLWKSAKYVDERKSVYDQLKLFETEENNE